MKQQFVKVLSTIFPKLMTYVAYQQATNPSVYQLSPQELAIISKAEKKILQFKGFDIQTYKWGNPTHKKVLLIHGWEGQAGNFRDLILKLLQEQYYIIAFDAPSHGFSSKGATNLFEFSNLVGILIKQYQCSFLISHSFGGIATTLALSKNKDIVIDKYVLLTTPDKFDKRINAAAKTAGITKKVRQALIDRLGKELNVDIYSIQVSKFVPTINVKEALIIHDKDDKVIPLDQSQSVCSNWENCSLKIIEGTGHFRILRTDSVLNNVINFLN